MLSRSKNLVPFKATFFPISILIGLYVFPFGVQAQSSFKSGISDRKSLSITIYNGGIGLIRESRTVALPKGRSTLQFEDVASSILPQTVRIRPGNRNPFVVFEQNYEYDLISNKRLLEKYVGKELTLVTTNPKTGEESFQKAKLIAYNDGPVYLINNQISLGHPGRVLVPSIPDNLYEKPTLIWELLSENGGPADLDVSYQTGGMNWSADYNLHLSSSETAADLQSWVTLNNSSGTAFENATLQLIAGKVQLLSGHSLKATAIRPRTTMLQDAEVSAPTFEQENLSEYYLYTLDQPITIRNLQTKQVQLFSSQNLKIDKRFVFENLPIDTSGTPKHFYNAKIRYEILNTKLNQLGRPLPSGTVRVFKSDSKNRIQLLGEDTIDHTPENEWVRIGIGEAFDIVANLIQTGYQKFKITEGYKSSYIAEVRNRKKESVTVRLYVPVNGEWKITDHSHKYEKESQFRIYFDLNIPAGKIEKVQYTVENAL